MPIGAWLGIAAVGTILGAEAPLLVVGPRPDDLPVVLAMAGVGALLSLAVARLPG